MTISGQTRWKVSSVLWIYLMSSEEHTENIWREGPLQKNWKYCIKADQLDILAR